MPMYSLKAVPNIDALLAKQLIHKHNGSFANEIFKFENSMIDFLQPYSKGLEQNLSAFSNRENEGSDDNRPMLNDNGSASIDYCQLDTENQIPLLLYIHPPTRANVVIIDIGSGWGTCAKQLALLGYKVYSIDIDQHHLDFQKNNFCKMPAIDTFLYQYWKVTNPQILDEHIFQNYCNKVKDKNIVYIVGNFADEKTVKKIDQKQWNIVLSLDSLQFMNQKDRENTFKLVNQYLQEKGIFIIKTKSKSDYGSDNPLIYDFDLHNSFQKTFSDYKILSAWISTSRILGLTLYKLTKEYEGELKKAN
jgi:precorrin-6B methylase 2